jgi:hypothetical protein
MGEDFVIPGNSSSKALRVPAGYYRAYFKLLRDPEGLYRGQDLDLRSKQRGEEESLHIVLGRGLEGDGYRVWKVK